jgi:hypothetical protein
MMKQFKGKQGSVEYIHGSLLVIKELLQQGGMFMHEHYQEVLRDHVFRQKDHRDVQIRRTVVMLIPELANYSHRQSLHNRTCTNSWSSYLACLRRTRTATMRF